MSSDDRDALMGGPMGNHERRGGSARLCDAETKAGLSLYRSLAPPSPNETSSGADAPRHTC